MRCRWVPGAVALVAWSRDRYTTGIPLGLALATVPKPALIPILVWMLLFRRRALGGAVAGSIVATGIGVAVLGISTYATWIDVLRHPLYFEGGQAGNLALGAYFPAPVTLALDALALAAFAVALWRGETPGFVAALAVGLLVAPYTIAYSAVFLLLAVRPLGSALPLVVLAVLAITAPLLVIVFLPLLAAVILAIPLFVPPSRWAPLAIASHMPVETTP